MQRLDIGTPPDVTPLSVHLDTALRALAEVYPAAGSLTSSVRVAPERLFNLVGKSCADV